MRLLVPCLLLYACQVKREQHALLSGNRENSQKHKNAVSCAPPPPRRHTTPRPPSHLRAVSFGPEHVQAGDRPSISPLHHLMGRGWSPGPRAHSAAQSTASAATSFGHPCGLLQLKGDLWFQETHVPRHPGVTARARACQEQWVGHCSGLEAFRKPGPQWRVTGIPSDEEVEAGRRELGSELPPGPSSRAQT